MPHALAHQYGPRQFSQVGYSAMQELLIWLFLPVNKAGNSGQPELLRFQ